MQSRDDAAVFGGGWLDAMSSSDTSQSSAGHLEWMADRLRRHRGNADVVRQELACELGVLVSLRRWNGRCRICDPSLLRRRRRRCGSRPPGRQLQIDFGQRRISIESGGRGTPFQPKEHKKVAAWGCVTGAVLRFPKLGELRAERLTAEGLLNSSAITQTTSACYGEPRWRGLLPSRKSMVAPDQRD
jgi:hypothetical protein